MIIWEVVLGNRLTSRKYKLAANEISKKLSTSCFPSVVARNSSPRRSLVRVILMFDSSILSKG